MTARGWVKIGAVLALLAAALAAAAIFDLPLPDPSSPAAWAALGAALILYVLSQFAGGAIWALLLSGSGADVATRRAASQLLTSQIGKYLPGNVAHMLGRAALARADGVPLALSGAATVAELGCLLGGSVAIIAVALILAPDTLALLVEKSGVEPWTGRILAIAIGVFSLGVAGAFVLRQRAKAGRGSPQGARAFLAAITLQVVAFALLGVSLLLVCQALDPTVVPDPAYAVLVFTFAWAAGFAAPGAPGGLGVRDGLIVAGLGLVMGAGPALAVAILHRAVSVAGDVVAFFVGLSMRGGTKAQLAGSA